MSNRKKIVFLTGAGMSAESGISTFRDAGGLWEQYPVIRLDISMAKAQADANELRSTLLWLLRPLADIYGREADENSPGKLLTG